MLFLIFSDYLPTLISFLSSVVVYAAVKCTELIGGVFTGTYLKMSVNAFCLGISSLIKFYSSVLKKECAEEGTAIIVVIKLFISSIVKLCDRFFLMKLAKLSLKSVPKLKISFQR